MFNRKPESAPSTNESIRPATIPEQSSRTPAPAQASGLLSRGVLIKGSVKFRNQLLIDAEVEGSIDSPGALTIGEHARIRGEVRAKSVQVKGTVDGNIFATERCELQAGCTIRGDIKAPRLIVDEQATFLGSADVGA